MPRAWLLIVLFLYVSTRLGTVYSEAETAGPHARRTKHRQDASKLFSRIAEDLAPWKESGITLQMVERTYCTPFTGGTANGGFRLQVIDGAIYVVGEIPGWPEFNRYIKLFITDVARHHRLPDVDLVLTTSDACHPPGHFPGNLATCPDVAPLLAYDKKDSDKHCVVYPDHTFAGWPTANLPAWQDVWELMERRKHRTPWANRMPQLYFRGAKTGNRAWLAEDAAFMKSEDVDVVFSGWTGDTSYPFVTVPEHCDHRYLLHLPGQAYSARLKYLLLCNATVIFPPDGNNEFYYHMLQDDVNVVMPEPLSWDGGGGGILQALHLLRKDPARAERIATAGYDLVQSVLRPENVRRYFVELLKAYAALQRFKPKLHADAIPLEVSALGPDRNLTMAGRTCNVCL